MHERRIPSGIPSSTPRVRPTPRAGSCSPRLARQIEVAARQGGGDIEGNPTLRTMVQKARDASMPKDNIERAIKRGTGELEGVTYEQVNYEGYAPHGVAVYVETLTDNRNRTGAEVKNVFTRNGGSLAEPGAVSWQFERKGVIILEKAAASEDDLMLAALEAGAEDIEDQGDTWQVTTPPTELHVVRDRARGGGGIAFTSSDLTMLPSQSVPLDDASRGEVRAAGHRRARGARRRAERLRELRHPRRPSSRRSSPEQERRTMAVEVGDKAPDFTLPGVEGTERTDYTLSDYRGRKVVLAFYPGDFTPGCTKQMCQYRDQFEEFQGVEAVLLGISPQDVDSHEKWIEKKRLPVPAARRHREDGDRGVRRARLRPDRGEALDVRHRRRGHRAPQAQSRRSA